MTDKIEQLKQQRERITKAIRAEENKLKDKERKDDTRRKILVGALIMTEAENDPALKSRIEQLLKDKLERNDDRALFNISLISDSKEDKT
jgi:hypothetical protein